MAKKTTDYRHVLFSLIVAVLFAFLVMTSIEAVYPGPEYSDYCTIDAGISSEKPNLSEELLEARAIERQECEDTWQEDREFKNFITFVTGTLMGLGAIIVGIYLPMRSNFHITLGNGLLLGGLLSMFFATTTSWMSIATQLRPFILLFELTVVIIVAYKKFSKNK